MSAIPVCPKCGKRRARYSANTPYCKVCYRNYQRQQHHIRKLKPLLLSRTPNCPICNQDLHALPSAQLHVDHLHETGLIRGLLCKPCNTGLGMFRDSVPSLRAAVTYLEESTPKDPRSLFGDPDEEDEDE